MATTINLYVNKNTGLDTNSGTYALPFKTLTKAMVVIHASKATYGTAPYTINVYVYGESASTIDYSEGFTYNPLTQDIIKLNIDRYGTGIPKIGTMNIDCGVQSLHGNGTIELNNIIAYNLINFYLNNTQDMIPVLNNCVSTTILYYTYSSFNFFLGMKLINSTLDGNLNISHQTYGIRFDKSASVDDVYNFKMYNTRIANFTNGIYKESGITVISYESKNNLYYNTVNNNAFSLDATDIIGKPYYLGTGSTNQYAYRPQTTDNYLGKGNLTTGQCSATDIIGRVRNANDIGAFECFYNSAISTLSALFDAIKPEGLYNNDEKYVAQVYEDKLYISFTTDGNKRNRVLIYDIPNDRWYFDNYNVDSFALINTKDGIFNFNGSNNNSFVNGEVNHEQALVRFDSENLDAYIMECGCSDDWLSTGFDGNRINFSIISNYIIGGITDKLIPVSFQYRALISTWDKLQTYFVNMPITIYDESGSWYSLDMMASFNEENKLNIPNYSQITSTKLFGKRLNFAINNSSGIHRAIFRDISFNINFVKTV